LNIEKPDFTTCLQVESVSKYFGSIQILDRVSFAVEAGEILGLIGPNGAGKTTLMECLAGLLPYEKGEVYWQGRPVAGGERRELLWYQPDDVRPFADQPVAATLAFFRRAHLRDEDFLRRLRERLELDAVAKKPLGTLSKGYRRRVLLAIALLSRQALLLLDEPFDGFDLRQTLGIMELLRAFRGERTMLLSIHQLSEAEKICDRFLLLDQGRVLGIGSLRELAESAGLAPQAGLEEVFLALT
jgi:ABC-2 type transport system ATP-binding protein